MKIMKVEVEDMKNAGCNNGNYPAFTVVFNTGEIYDGITCRCGHGCSGTDRLPEIGQEFGSWEEFNKYLEL